jgi:D-glycero-alpha-D-manno-heptose-7-phosphate kinase
MLLALFLSVTELLRQWPEFSTVREGDRMTAPGISTDRINRLYDVTFDNDALAGKVSGAGDGGFVMFLAHPEDGLGLLCALGTAGGTAGSVKFVERGCEL